jgi:hypothetical protein
MTYVRQCVDEGIKFAKIIYEKCSQLKKKSHNHLKSPGIYNTHNNSIVSFATAVKAILVG